ncbi:MAG: GGDEF domain-containing protein [Candidatus Limnocylindria bacterium]
MERHPSGHDVRAVLMLLAVGVLLAPIILLGTVDAAGWAATGPTWVPQALGAGLLAAAGMATVASLVGGLRHGSLSCLLLAGASAALVGGALALLTGSISIPLTITAAAIFTLAAAGAQRTEARLSGRRTRVTAACLLLVLAEAAVVADLLPPLGNFIGGIRPSLFLAAAALAGLAAIITATRNLGPPSAVLAAGAMALSLAPGEAAAAAPFALTTLTGAALLSTRSVIASGPDAIVTDDERLPELAAHLSEGVLRFDGHLKLRAWNPAAAALLALDEASEGIRLEDLLGLGVQQLPAGSETVLHHMPLGGLDLSIHRDETAIMIVMHEPAQSGSAERLGRELRDTIEELFAARRTVDLQRAELERAASMDPLTGVASHAAILDRLQTEVAQARRYRHSVAVLLLDVDRFGEIHSARGSEGGDAVLREIALRVRLRVRAADALGRWGTHGLLSIMPHTDEGGAATFADALRRRIGQQLISIEETEVAVTLSAGVAVMRPGDDLAFDELLARAEEALASARSAGGNRIALDRMHGLARLDRPLPTPDAEAEDGA